VTANGEVKSVVDLIDNWTANRKVITEMSAGHDRNICWACGIRPRQISVPGIPVGWCRVCDTAMAAMKEEEA